MTTLLTVRMTEVLRQFDHLEFRVGRLQNLRLALSSTHIASLDRAFMTRITRVVALMPQTMI
jgi:hypothetical protein